MWALQRLRAGKPVRATDLALEFAVALRTADRDFGFLRDDWCVPLETDAYDRPRGFDVRKYLADAFGIEKRGRTVGVAVRFAPRQARWIRERKWHRSARIQEGLDGSPRAV